MNQVKPDEINTNNIIERLVHEIFDFEEYFHKPPSAILIHFDYLDILLADHYEKLVCNLNVPYGDYRFKGIELIPTETVSVFAVK